LVRPGGLIAVDNVLWGGAVVNSDDQQPETKAIREVTTKIFQDNRVDVSLVPIGDGIMLARKR
jgi:caffeoyl-CoA O-methyltransferase